MSSVGRVIGERLHAAGVRHVFGHPGGEVVDLIEGLRQAGLEFVLARHETGAALTERAVRVAMRPRRGPVFLEVPSDVPSQEAAASQATDAAAPTTDAA